jgi:glycosyltransferase involved in cell wall biosynthesis
MSEIANSYPKVLVVASGRINASDTANGGLLLRNLFAMWPKGNLAQIYSSGDNGDEGFFGDYYRLGSRDRRFGWLYFLIKGGARNLDELRTTVVAGEKKRSFKTRLKAALIARLGESGLYELLFRPVLSRQLHAWIDNFKPDIIFAHGYTLTATWIPLQISASVDRPICFYTTDDWPEYLYADARSRNSVIQRMVRRAVRNSSGELVRRARVCIAFNRFMQEEYRQRYGKDFTVLMHGDSFLRFAGQRSESQGAKTEHLIVSTGIFNENRMPLLTDLDEACAILMSRGVSARAVVYPVNLRSDYPTFRHVSFEACPAHNDLAAILRGADILFLPERFDDTAHDIRLSVSSKAHLFMFSGRPTIVYSDPRTGIARYGTEDKWAAVVDKRDPQLLADSIERLIKDAVYCEGLLEASERTARKNHDLSSIQSTFLDLVQKAVHGPRI